MTQSHYLLLHNTLLNFCGDTWLKVQCHCNCFLTNHFNPDWWIKYVSFTQSESYINLFIYRQFNKGLASNSSWKYFYNFVGKAFCLACPMQRTSHVAGKSQHSESEILALRRFGNSKYTVTQLSKVQPKCVITCAVGTVVLIRVHV